MEGRDRLIGVDVARRLRVGLRMNIGTLPLMALNAAIFFLFLRRFLAPWMVAGLAVMYLPMALLLIPLLRRHRQVRRFLDVNA